MYPTASGEFSTLIDILRWRTAHQPDRQACVFVRDHTSEAVTLTYESLDAQARAIGARLQSMDAGGQRVLLLYPSGLSYFTALLGCMYAGAIAVPMYPPDPRDQLKALSRLRGVIDNARPAVALTTRDALSIMRSAGLQQDLSNLQWIATDEISTQEAAAWQEPGVTADSLAMLQYTSGSTRLPRGVMLSHANLLHNLDLARHGFQLSERDTTLFWLPLYHDMGLIGGLLGAVAIGMPVVLMTPTSFLRRPAGWLQAIARFRATVSGAPNFAYDHTVDRISPEQLEGLDLSHWRLAFCGAEPIRPRTLDRFATTLAPCGFRRSSLYPCYGLAEATLIVSGGDATALPVVRTFQREGLEHNRGIDASPRDGDARALVGCGTSLLDQTIEIVDPHTMLVCPPNHIGEIWVAGRSVACGYWDLPEETEETFGALLADSGRGPFLRTGDLGFLRDGELFVTGRRKDLLIFQGRNFAPQDIEWTVGRCHPALQPHAGAAVSIDVEQQERLLIVQEVKRGHRKTLIVDEVGPAIRQAVMQAHGVSVYAVALVERIPRTTSGKVQRHACRDGYLGGDLPTLATWQTSLAQAPAIEPTPACAPRNEAEIRSWLVSRLASRVGCAPEAIDVSSPLSYYGLDSIQLASLSSELEVWLGQPVSLMLVFEYPTIDALAEHLGAGASEHSPAARRASRSPASDEPIAIIGIGCRFPGAEGPRAFFDLLRDGVDAITAIPREQRPYYAGGAAPLPEWGGFLSEIDQFEPRFFGITPREAAQMDPQQRLLLEVTWEALEDAGQQVRRLRGSSTSVFVGISGNDYSRIQTRDPLHSDALANAGNALSIAANRISYVFDWRGPSMSIDTACSSSLVAIHLAASSLLRGECDLAIAGGVNLVLSARTTANFVKAGFMAPDGRCKAFDARADGYVRGEGAGVVVLKPLSRAQADGDAIYAVVRGSAVNSDGRTNGLTAPGLQAQEAVLLEAYRAAGIQPGQVGYIEAHGTGTALGDPIEVEALSRVLREGRASGSRCALGSVKTNIGHLEAAAGIAGVIKTALMISHRELLPSLHFEVPNPEIAFEKSPLQVQTEHGPWPEDRPVIAGVSSFGFGGTNAHVVLEKCSGQPESAPPEEAAAQHLLTLSAQCPQSLRELTRATRDMLRESPSDTTWRDVCYSASVRRSHLDHRLSLVAHSLSEAADLLEALWKGEAPRNTSTGQRKPEHLRPGVVFAFGGQGPQWWGMGRQLLATEPVFRAALEECSRWLGEHVQWSLMDQFHVCESESRLHETEVAQPALFGLQMALVALLRHWGVTPTQVVGHSVGEIAAACTAGVLRLEDGVRVAAVRGRLMQRTQGTGKMVAVSLSPDEARRALQGSGEQLSLAALNGPASTVISGEAQAIDAFLDRLGAEVSCRVISTSYAFHSAQMEPLQAELEAALHELQVRPASCPIVSTLTGALAQDTDFDPSYWARQLRQPVLFAEAVASVGSAQWVEIGPHPVLSSVIRQGLEHQEDPGSVVTCLHRGLDERTTMLACLGALYTQGQDVHWARLHPAGGHPFKLPSYRWQRTRCWAETVIDEPTADTRSSPGGHPLLGARVPLAHHPTELVWQQELDVNNLGVMREHRVQDAVVLPATAFMELALAAAELIFGEGTHTLIDLEVLSALVLAPERARTLQFVSARDSGDGDADLSWRVHSRPAAGTATPWTLHARGRLRRARGEVDSPLLEHVDVETTQQRCPDEMSGEEHYRRLSRKGLRYGPGFQGVARLWRGSGEALGSVLPPLELRSELERYHLHPALMDACAQVLLSLDDDDRAVVPVGLGAARFYKRPAGPLWSQAQLIRPASSSTGEMRGNVRVLDDSGSLVAEAVDLRLRDLDRTETDNPDSWRYLLQWQPEPAHRPEQSGDPIAGTWILLADDKGVADALAKALREAGGNECVLVSPGATYERRDARHYLLPPGSTDDARRLLEDVRREDGPPCGGVVHLWSLDAPPTEQLTVPLLEQVQRLGTNTVVALVQEMAQASVTSSARLWLVTKGAQTTDGSPPTCVAPASIWGLGRTIAQEQPGLWGGLVDLEPDGHAPEEGQLLSRTLRHPGPEQQIAYRQGRPYVARLVRQPRADSANFSWRHDGAYLITGGLGGLGLTVARWMVTQGARRLILLSRTELLRREEWSRLPPGSRAAQQAESIRALEALGASVHLASVDVSEEQELTAFLDTYRREGWPPIRGVIHAAGVLEDRVIMGLNASMMDTVFRAKAIGGWLLHRHLAQAGLDFFVAFTSVSSVLGAAGQGNYAAANAFLDALAHHRQAQGQPGLSINWGPWAEVGMAAQARDAKRLERQGLGSIRAETGLSVLGQLLGQEATQVCVAPFDWGQLVQAYPLLRGIPLISSLVAELDDGKKPDNHGHARAAVLQAAPEQRLGRMVTLIADDIAKVVGLDAGQLDLEQPLSELGVDSLLGIEMKSRLEAGFGVTIGLMQLGAYSTRELAESVLGQVIEPGPGPEAASGSSARSELVAIQPLGSRSPFFCVHPGALDTGCYRKLAEHLGQECPFFALQPGELDNYLQQPDTLKPIEDIGRRCVEAILSVQEQGPYLLGGWSLGGIVALEIAQQLIAEGEEVQLLAIFDSPSPTTVARETDHLVTELLPPFASYLGARQGKAVSLTAEALAGLSLDAQFGQVLKLAQDHRVLPAEVELPQLRSFFATYRNGLLQGSRQVWAYEPSAYPGQVVYFRARETLGAFEEVFPSSVAGWRTVSVGQCTVHEVSGNHYTMFMEPEVEEMSAILGASFRQAPASSNR